MLDTAIVLGIVLPFLLFLGVPFAISLALAAVASLYVSDIDQLVLAQRLVSGTQSFSLLAVPLFVLAGELMTHGGLSRRLVAVANAFVRHRTGGLGLVMVVSATFFAAISGSAPATTAAVGTILIPEMEKNGYERPFAAALAVASGIIGPIIPPSITFIIAAASSIGWLIALEQYPPKIAAMLLQFEDHPWLVLLMLNVMLLIIGAIMDIVAAMIILSGVLVAVGSQLGMDGVQLGAMVATNFVIGMATPPFGYALFVGAAISGCSIGQISRPLLPLIGVLLIVLALITYVPATTLAIQSLF